MIDSYRWLKCLFLSLQTIIFYVYIYFFFVQRLGHDARCLSILLHVFSANCRSIESIDLRYMQCNENIKKWLIVLLVANALQESLAEFGCQSQSAIWGPNVLMLIEKWGKVQQLKSKSCGSNSPLFLSAKLHIITKLSGTSGHGSQWMIHKRLAHNRKPINSCWGRSFE